MLDLSRTSIDGGKVEFGECLFEGEVRGLELQVFRGAIRFERCVFDKALVTFRSSGFGLLFDEPRLWKSLLGRTEEPDMAASRSSAAR